MAKEKSNGMVSLKEAYEKAMNEKKDTKEINTNNKKNTFSKKATLSPNTSVAKIDSSFELESFVKMNHSTDNQNKKQKKDTSNGLDFNFEGLGIQVARRF